MCDLTCDPRTNITLTDRQFARPIKTKQAGVGVLAPWDPLFPYAYMTPLWNEEELMAFMEVCVRV